MLVADPRSGGAAHKLTELIGHAQGFEQLKLRLWMPTDAALPAHSPWLRFAQPGTLFSAPHPAPACLLLSDAADWQAAQRIYGPRLDLPKLHLLHGASLRDWGHGASRSPAVRVSCGEAVAEALRQQGRFVEPLHTLPMGIDTQALPPVAPLKQGCLILARAQPELGLALQQAIAAQGYGVSCELSPWSVQRWQQALAEAAVVIVLPPGAGSPGLGLRRLAAMALGTALVVAERSSPDSFCRDGQNALVRLLDAAELSSAALQLLADVRLRERLVQAAKATLQRHRSALERQRFLELLHQLPEHWQAACRSHQLESQR